MTPPIIRAIGLGANGRADGAAVAEVLTHLGTCDRLATVRFRATMLSALAGHLLEGIPEDDLRGIPTPTVSPRVMARYGTGSVAEACALVAAGKAARIVVRRISSADGSVTGAMAEGEGP